LTYEDGNLKYGHNVYTGYFAQHQSETLNTDRSVLEEAASVSPGLPEQEVRNLLAAFLFSGDDVQKKVKVLSGGEKSRLALVKILLAPPNFLLMDEPTNHLDIPSCEILEQGLKRYSGTLVMITHDRRLMNEVCTALLEIKDGAAEQYLGNYDDYEYKKKLMEKEQEVDIVQTAVPAPRPAAPVVSGESRKERKRREAQDRIALSKRQAPIKTEIERIEERMQTTGSRLKEIEVQMAEPSNYENKDRIVPLLQECSSLSQEMKELETRWEELHTRLEEMEGTSLSA
jgi:ATP-binding cassette, subfamily F, member 3